MKTRVILLCLSISYVWAKVRVDLDNSSYLQLKTSLRVKDGESNSDSKSTTYLTLIEGSQDVYKTCQSICRERKEQTYYAEATDYPNYGKIFRCQCGDKFTSWYSMHDLNEINSSILMGDNLFNNYMNMLGFEISDCECDDLKRLLIRLLK
jgi:hypothetical protein